MLACFVVILLVLIKMAHCDDCDGKRPVAIIEVTRL